MSEVTKVVSAENAPINSSMNYAKKYEASYEDGGGSGGAFYVEFSYDGDLPLTPSVEHPLTANKTFAEIKAAFDVGMIIIGEGSSDSDLSIYPPTIGAYYPAEDNQPDGFSFIFYPLVTGTNSNSITIADANITVDSENIGGNGNEYILAKST